MIQDSGDRTEFETGAVRDCSEGKGRCDLMPLEVVAELFGDMVLENIGFYKNGMGISYLYEALEIFSRCNYDCCQTMILEVAKHFEEGAKKYGENNWQKGIPENRYIDSAIRHYLKFLRDDKDERHDRAFVWNIMCLIWTHDYMEGKNEQESKKGIREEE